MLIVLISDSETKVNFFPNLERKLKAQILDLEVEKHFLPFMTDIPAKIVEVSEEADLIFVFVLYKKKDFKVQTLLNKLIDLEIEKKTKIIKVIEEMDAESLDEFELIDLRKELAEKWSKFIINFLFHKKKI